MITPLPVEFRTRIEVIFVRGALRGASGGPEAEDTYMDFMEVLA